MRTLAAATALLCVFASSAEARTHRHHHSHHHYYQHHHYSRHFSHRYAGAGRPSAWCGWYMRTQVGRDPDPQYSLARPWARYAVSAGAPSVGAIVVWPHHVGTIVGRENNGEWIVR